MMMIIMMTMMMVMTMMMMRLDADGWRVMICASLPASGICTFSDIYLEVDGEEVTDVAWEAKQETPKCNSVATVKDPKVHARGCLCVRG